MGKVFLILTTVIVLVVAVAAAAVLIPLNTGKAAGVVFQQADQDSFAEKSGLTINDANRASLLDLFTDNYVIGNMVAVNATFTSAEFTAYLNCYFAPTLGMENLQVKFDGNNRIVLSCKATEEAASLFGDAPELESIKNYLWLAKGKTLRIEETVTSTDGIITTKLDKVYVGQIDITGFVPDGTLPIGTALNILFNVESSAGFSLNKDSLSLNCTMPDVITKK